MRIHTTNIMKQIQVTFNEELRNKIKIAIQELLNDPECDRRIPLTIDCINQLNVFDRNFVYAYMFLCDYSVTELAHMFGISRQAANGRIITLNKQIQAYVKSHIKSTLPCANCCFCC